MVNGASNITGGCLKGVRVIDLTRVLAGPYCTMILADMGADVIKVERKGCGDDSREYPPFLDGMSTYFGDLNRNKRSVDLDLKDEKDREIFKDLIISADVVVENFKPGTMEKLGFSYDTLKEYNPKIIFASISGFGQYGRYKDRPGYDIIGQAMSGFMSVTGWPGTAPTRTGTAIGDILGGLNACIGILGALKGREITGKGERIDVALVDSCVSAMNTLIQLYLVEDRVPAQIGNRYEFIYPYDTFEASDGWVSIAVGNDAVWERFCKVMGREDLFKMDKYKTNIDRVKHHEELNSIISEMTKKIDKKAIVEMLLSNSVPSSEILDLEEVTKNNHIALDREMVIDIPIENDKVMQVTGTPIKFTENCQKDYKRAPFLGEHRDEIVKELKEIL